ncbi:hypothetical protein [Labilibacter marinus]|nr:hypothetical protein [Labilibacter marinus]
MSTNKLDKYIPTVTDLSDWTINLYANTGRSRAKRIASEPVTDDLYFVKG